MHRNRFLIGVACLLLSLLVVGGVLLPRLVSPERLAEEVRALVRERTGVVLDSRGGVTFSLLPQPAVILRDVTATVPESMFGNAAKGHASVIVCRPSWRSLLEGRLLLAGLELEDAVIEFEMALATDGLVSGTVAGSAYREASETMRRAPALQGGTGGNGTAVATPVSPAGDSVLNAPGSPDSPGSPEAPGVPVWRDLPVGVAAFLLRDLPCDFIRITRGRIVVSDAVADGIDFVFRRTGAAAHLNLQVSRVGQSVVSPDAGFAVPGAAVSGEAASSGGVLQHSGPFGGLHLKDVRVEIDDMRFLSAMPGGATPEPVTEATPQGIGAAVRVASGVGGSLAEGEVLFAADVRFVHGHGVLVDAGELGGRGTVALGGVPVPFELDIPFHRGAGQAFVVQDAALRLEGDSARLDAVCTLEGDVPVMEGALRLGHLSLPRWFGFARRLPPGLQHALDALQGTLDFRLTPQGVEVSRLEARVLDYVLRGRGGVTSFAAPVIFIEAGAPALDVNRIVPEITGRFPDAPRHDAPPPVPVPGTARAAAMDIPDVGYDIRIHTDAARVRGFDVGRLDFRCSPSASGTALLFDAPEAYGGAIRALLDILPVGYALDATLRRVRVAKPASILAGREVLTGLLDADMKLTAKGGPLASVLASMSGSLDATIKDGRIEARRKGHTEMLPLQLLRVSSRAQGAGLQAGAALPSRLWWSGAWQASWAAPGGWEGSLTFDGPLAFSTSTGLPESCSDVPAMLSMRFPSGDTANAATSKLLLKGNLSADTAQHSFTFSGLKGEVAGASVTGHARVSDRGGSSEQWAGTFVARHARLRDLLSRFGFDPGETADPDAFGPVSLRGTLAGDARGWEFSSFEAEADGSRMTGTMGYRFATSDTARPKWTFDVSLDRLDVDAHLPPPVHDSPPSEEPWDVSWMRRVDAEGLIRIREAVFRRQPLSRVVIPVSLNAGVLEVIPATAGFSGGRVTSSLRSEAGAGLTTRLRFDAVDFDLSPLVMRHWNRDYLGGKAHLSFDVEGLVVSSADIPRVFDGTWGFEVRDGFYSLRGAVGQEGRTPFSLASAKGTMMRGVLHNDDFSLRSLLMSMSGRGWVDLGLKRIDYTTDITLAKIPNLPIRFHGDLHSPKATVRELGIVTGTIGNIGSGVFGLLEGVLTAPLRVLESMGAGGARGDDTGGRSVSPPLGGDGGRPAQTVP